MVVSISFLLGLVYEITNTLYTTILAHFIIDFVFACQIRMQYLREVKEENE
jgi:membrane protease YdiL (CAAX protease family)